MFLGFKRCKKIINTHWNKIKMSRKKIENEI